MLAMRLVECGTINSTKGKRMETGSFSDKQYIRRPISLQSSFALCPILQQSSKTAVTA